METPAKHTTRESWLLDATHRMRSWFSEHGHEVPEKVSVSCGFPLGSRKAIGQAWDHTCTEDGTRHMFISPVLSDIVVVLATLLHEMVHVTLGNDKKHGKEFAHLAKRQLGLQGKVTATYAAEGTPLYNRLAALGEELGPYPHMRLTPKMAVKDSSRKGEWVRYKSTNEEEYTVVVSKKNIEAHGVPKDPWGEDMEPKE